MLIENRGLSGFALVQTGELCMCVGIWTRGRALFKENQMTLYNPGKSVICVLVIFPRITTPVNPFNKVARRAACPLRRRAQKCRVTCPRLHSHPVPKPIQIPVLFQLAGIFAFGRWFWVGCLCGRLCPTSEAPSWCCASEQPGWRPSPPQVALGCLHHLTEHRSGSGNSS